MNFRVEELAAEADVSVDTIRYYQGLGLIAPPERDGRTALYGADHLTQLETVKQLAAKGFSLAQIQALTAEDRTPLLAALVEESLDRTTYSTAELAEAAGIAEPLVDMAVAAGLLEPVGDDAPARFGDDAVSMLVAGKSLLEAGIPLDQLAAVATRHATGIEDVVDDAINLFSDHVRPSQSDDVADLGEMFKLLLGHATKLVAQHFEQTVIARAKERLVDSEDTALLEAVVAADAQTFVVSTEWR